MQAPVGNYAEAESRTLSRAMSPLSAETLVPSLLVCFRIRILLLLFLLMRVCSASASETHGLLGDSHKESLPSNGTQTADSWDHRVILRPGVWKIRTTGSREEYFTYNFFLGFNWTELKFEYPNCSQVACRGLPESQHGCDRLCSTGAWSEASLALASARSEFNGAMDSLYAVLNDLAAIMDTHIPKATRDKKALFDNLFYRGKMSQSDRRVLDVMKPYRVSIENTVNDIVRNFPPELRENGEDNLRAHFTFNNTDFSEMMDSWKSTAFRLSVQLNAVTFAFQAAHRVLLSCAQGVLRSDMTGCERASNAEYYTDTPVASHLPSSSRLIMIVKREPWTPMSLSHWYMPFLDSSKGNRTCWLDRSMLSDAGSNYSADYKEPDCDWRGLCETLELDSTTVSGCQVDVNGELGPGCPVMCGANCFGPICYHPETHAYTGRMGTEPRDADAVQVTRSPRIVSRAVSLSDDDLPGSLASMRNLSLRSLDLLNKGETLLKNLKVVHQDVRKYAQEMRSNKAFHKDQESQWEYDLGHIEAISISSLVLSVVSCCLFVLVTALNKKSV